MNGESTSAGDLGGDISGGAAPAAGADLAGSAVGFARTLRAAGVPAGPQRVHAFLEALSVLDPHRREAVYWAGRVTLCAEPDDIERYDRVFAAFFDRRGPARATHPTRRVRLGADATSDTPASGGAADSDDVLTLRTVTRRASAAERLRHRDIATLDAHERAELAQLLRAFRLPGESRRSRRRGVARRGSIDRRRTVRAMLAAGGEPGQLHHLAPLERPRRVLLLVDVSGSMAGYADALLRFAHAATRQHAGETEVFTLGTRLTRVSEPLRHRDVDTAMQEVAAAIPDWEGGTRLGHTLREFLDRWGQRGLARGAVVVVLSDGWETGEVRVLARQAERLQRLAHRVVWANPRAGRPGFTPSAAGMAAALPYCDQLVEGHSLGALEHLARIVAGGVDQRAARQARRDRARRLTAASRHG